MKNVEREGQMKHKQGHQVHRECGKGGTLVQDTEGTGVEFQLQSSKGKNDRSYRRMIKRKDMETEK